MIQVKFDITTDASGDYDSTDDESTNPQSDISMWARGPMLLYAVEWVDGDLVDGVDATLSMTETLSEVDKTLLTLTDANSDAWYYARALECDNAGTATDFYTMQVVDGKLKLVVSNGGDTKSGACIVYLMDM